MDGFARGKRKSSMSASFEVKPVPRNAKRGRGNLYREPIEFYGECCSRKRDLICQGNSRELNVQIGPKVSSHLFFYLFFFFFFDEKEMEHQNWKEKLVLLISSQIYVQTWFFSLFLSNVDRQSVRKFALLLVKSDFWLVLYWIWTYIYFLQTRWYLSKLSFFFAFNSHSRDAVFRSLSLFERREKEREREKSPWKIENHSVGSIGPIERACSSMVSGARKFLRGTRTVYRGFLSSDVSRLACVSMKQQREREREKKLDNRRCCIRLQIYANRVYTGSYTVLQCFRRFRWLARIKFLPADTTWPGSNSLRATTGIGMSRLNEFCRSCFPPLLPAFTLFPVSARSSLSFSLSFFPPPPRKQIQFTKDIRELSSLSLASL